MPAIRSVKNITSSRFHIRIICPTMETTFSISVCVAVILLFLSATEAVLPNGACYVNNMTCEIDDNFIGIVNNIMSAEQCKQECKNNSTDCNVYSYYGPTGAPFRDTCLLFSDCIKLDVVEDCITEDLKLEGVVPFCDAPMTGILGDNVLDIVSGISGAECETECDVVEQCQFFTHYYSNSTVNPNTCFLLSEIQGPITPCQNDTCTTASSNCENSACGFFENDVLVPNGIILNETKYVDLLTIGPCSATANGVLAVVVGGGGFGSTAGGGSGYIQFLELPSSQPFVQFEATVGSSDEQSMLSTISDGSSDILVSALPGGDSLTGLDGGFGYSGGGAYGACTFCEPPYVGGNGGSDGGDGQDVDDLPGGKGSGFDVRTVPLTHFELR